MPQSLLRSNLRFLLGVRWGLTAALLPALGGRSFAQSQSPDPGLISPYAPLTLPAEPEPRKTPADPNSVTPWWQTNLPPNNLITGPRLGTDAIGSLVPGFNPAPPPMAGGSAPSTPPILRWGPVTAHPFVSYGLTYGTGLPSGPSREENSVINTVSPGVSFDLGKYWNLAYTPSLVFYTTENFQNTVNQSASLSGGVTAGDWGLNLGSNFAKTDNPLVETGQQTDQTSSSTQFGASRPLSSVWTLDLGISQALRWTGDFNNTFSWAAQSGLMYQLSQQLSVGFDLGAGYDLVEPGTDMTHESFQVAVSGTLGDKLSYSIGGGFEIRQFLDTDASQKLSPIMNGSLNYQMTEKTSFNVYANRSVSPSFFDDQFTQATAIGGGLSQRVLGRFFLSLTGGFRWTENNSTLDPTQEVQNTDFSFVSISLSSRFLQRGSASIFYTLSQNTSSDSNLSFESNQAGMQLSYGW